MTLTLIRNLWERLQRSLLGRGAMSTPPADDMEWFFPPSDVHDVQAWDQYWNNQVEHGLTPLLFDMFVDSRQLIRMLSARQARTVLCAGNGISQEPKVLAAAGFTVTAVDLSPAAVRLGETWQPNKENTEECGAEVSPIPGGSVTFVIGDILDRSVCPGPFDAIIERCMLQLFPENERGGAFDALESRLEPAGLFLSHCHDGGWRPPGRPVHYVENCFRERNWLVWNPRRGETPDPAKRIAVLELSTG